MKCQKCGNEFRGKICPDCGFDVRAAGKKTTAGGDVSTSNRNTLIAIGLAVSLILALFVTVMVIFENSSEESGSGGQDAVEVTVQDIPDAPGLQSVQRGSQKTPTQGADLTGTPLLFEGGGVSIQLQGVFLTGTDLQSEFTLLVTNNSNKIKWVRTTDFILNGRPQQQDKLISVEPGDTVFLAIQQDPVQEGVYAGTSLGSLKFTFHVTDDASSTKNQVTDSVILTFGS